MNRRELVTLGMAAALARPSRATAQVLGRIPKIGMLWHAGSAEEEGSYFTSLIEGFKALGYVEGQTILFEHRYAHEQYDRFPTLAQELVGLKVDVIMASILPAAHNGSSTSTAPPRPSSASRRTFSKRTRQPKSMLPWRAPAPEASTPSRQLPIR
jgi:putative ABC transport system substrate-binding protein